MTPVFVPCPACDGSGRDEELSLLTGELEPCAACTGEGMVEETELD